MRYSVKRHILLAAVFAMAIAVTGTRASYAANNDTVRESITLSPAGQRLQLDPGDVKQLELTVVNDGATDYTFNLYARPYSVTNEDYTANFTAEAPNANAYQWVQFDTATFNIKAGKSLKVPYTVRVPQNATPGGHYGVLFAETQVKDSTDSTSIARKKRVGSIMYLTVSGTFKMKGSAESPEVAFFQLRPPLTAVHRITNDGNADFVATNTLQVYDVFGARKAEIKREYVVLPETTRKLPLTWTEAPWFGLYKVDVTTEYLDKVSRGTRYVLLAPLWVYLVIAMVVGARIIYALSQRKKLR